MDKSGVRCSTGTCEVGSSHRVDSECGIFVILGCVDRGPRRAVRDDIRADLIDRAVHGSSVGEVKLGPCAGDHVSAFEGREQVVPEHPVGSGDQPSAHR
jgi:hypothetical protein